MKAQMLIVTVIFLAGFVFAVQQIFLQSAAIDMPASAQRADFHVMKSIVNAVDEIVQKNKGNCQSVQDKLKELESFIETGSTKREFLVQMDLKVEPVIGSCVPSTGVEHVDMRLFIKGKGTESANDICFENDGSINYQKCQ